VVNTLKPKVLIFIVAYNAARTIEQVLRRIPLGLSQYDTEILVIDDSSTDATVDRARLLEKAGELPFPLTVLFNPMNLGYGGNQKVGFQYAIQNRFDFVALVHGDGQYAPECLPELLEPLVNGEADAAFGSRILRKGDALRGGMPLYKYVGNRILTTIQNRLLRSSLSEFHSGYRLYSAKALRAVPFDLNADGFDFDTDIIIQLLRAGLRIRELPIPTYYGDEICYVNGIKYAKDILIASFIARAQDLGIFYERKFDVGKSRDPYESKLGFDSSHTYVINRVPSASRVLDIGCASGVVSKALRAKGCRVTGIDRVLSHEHSQLERFVQHDLNEPKLPVDTAEFDHILLLDVIEHLQSPETFVDALRRSRGDDRPARVIVTSGNVGFIVTRLMLLLGSFNYGARGVLDLTHTRLFTFGTLTRLFEQAGYRIEEVQGIPAPLPLAIGFNTVSRALLRLNKFLIRASKRLFSYQILIVASPLPSNEWLLAQAIKTRDQKARAASA
jgi:glycosyltransferase involved in cell wall biosynthesis